MSMERLIHLVVIECNHVVDGTMRIKAIEYSEKSEGILLNECLDEVGGLIPSHTQDGRKLTYKINVTNPGKYQVNVRVASENKSAYLELLIYGERSGVFLWVKGSGEWQNWETQKLASIIELTEGEHTLEFKFGTAMNLNWFEFVEKK